MLNQPGAAGPGDLSLAFRRQFRNHGAPGGALRVDRDVAHACRRAGARHRLAGHGAEVEARVKPKMAQPRATAGSRGASLSRLVPSDCGTGFPSPNRHTSRACNCAGFAVRFAVCNVARG